MKVKFKVKYLGLQQGKCKASFSIYLPIDPRTNHVQSVLHDSEVYICSESLSGHWGYGNEDNCRSNSFTILEDTWEKLEEKIHGCIVSHSKQIQDVYDRNTALLESMPNDREIHINL
jgi:hypothetical protein